VAVDIHPEELIAVVTNGAGLLERFLNALFLKEFLAC
jgi:hypothetical protein